MVRPMGVAGVASTGRYGRCAERERTPDPSRPDDRAGAPPPSCTQRAINHQSQPFEKCRSLCSYADVSQLSQFGD